jgi:hypothetical protein
MVLFCSGCMLHPFHSDEYTFTNPTDQIISIELIENQNEEGYGIDEEYFHVICTVEQDQFASLMEKVYRIPTEYLRCDPRFGYGPYIIKVTYSNGDVEILGSDNIEYVPYGKDPCGTSFYVFDDIDAFMNIFNTYAKTTNESDFSD